MTTGLIPTHAGTPAFPPTLTGYVRDFTRAWLLSYGSANTRDAYRRDIEMWFAFCEAHELDILEVRRPHGDVYKRWLDLKAGKPLPAKTLARRLATVSSWYSYLVEEAAAEFNPFERVRRPKVDRQHSETVALTRAEARDVLLAADHDHGRERLRTAALIRLLMETGVRVTEALAAQLSDLGYERGHRTLRIVAKGSKPKTRKVPPAAAHAIDCYLTDRAERTGLAVEHLDGPLFASGSGQRLDRKDVYELVERIGRQAGIEGLHPHQLRHTFAMLAEMGGVASSASFGKIREWRLPAIQRGALAS
ncbi:tyrosine-type recombinase/integrase [Nonomuraea turcica]|uniref:tyrosine-type recombinase/integrase n=1 Tax=Nonomuraea sp. G32 TaxID=3067274 RepID=UPI00273C6417|nr:tyrosine-type recombinase/integrase [Nonomuraea sp. G32]MDP4505086.1 tyrosine-type recombinase/integrase [Nonomuraea sp. G32]